MLETLLTNFPLSFHIFMALATITVLGACGVAFSTNIVYSAFSLLTCFAGVTGLFAFLSADFLAAVQLMVYIGGVLVLILFAVMLTHRINTIEGSNPRSNAIVGGSVFAALFGLMMFGVANYDWPVKEPAPYAPTAAQLGNAFLGTYLLPFEIGGILLLAALLAAVVVARKEVKNNT